jgi:hypothetical protein
MSNLLQKLIITLSNAFDAHQGELIDDVETELNNIVKHATTLLQELAQEREAVKCILDSFETSLSEGPLAGDKPMGTSTPPMLHLGDFGQSTEDVEEVIEPRKSRGRKLTIAMLGLSESASDFSDVGRTNVRPSEKKSTSDFSDVDSAHTAIEPPSKRTFTREHSVAQEQDEIHQVDDQSDPLIKMKCGVEKLDLYVKFDMDRFLKFLDQKREMDRCIADARVYVSRKNVDILVSTLKEKHAELIQNKHMLAYFYHKISTYVRSIDDRISLVKNLGLEMDIRSQTSSSAFRVWGSFLSTGHSHQWLGGTDATDFSVTSVNSWYAKTLNFSVNAFKRIRIDGVMCSVPHYAIQKS